MSLREIKIGASPSLVECNQKSLLVHLTDDNAPCRVGISGVNDVLNLK